MLRIRIFAPALLILIAAGIVQAQDFPVKPVRIATSVPGGGSDFSARIIAHGISGPLGQPVIVDNRSGVVAQEMVLKAAPDGYTLIVDGASLWIAPLVQKTSYDPVRDFAPIVQVTRQPTVLVIHPSLPVKSVKDLIALAKSRPGELNYASGNTGSVAHLSGELLKSLAGISITRVNYKGTGQAMNDLLGGQVQMMFASTGSAVTNYIKAGRLRGLAVSSAQPSALIPGIPTMAAAGVPGYETGSATGLFAPAHTPITVINRLNQEVTQLLQRAEVREKFVAIGVEVVANSPAEFAATIKSDIARMGKLIKDTGIRAE